MILLEELSLAYNYFIFDLDNTLIEETDYLFQGYFEIADHIAQKNKSLDIEDLYIFLTSRFINEGRKEIFNKLFEEYSINNIEIKDCLRILRTFEVKKSMTLFPECKSAIIFFQEREKNLFIVTNGNVLQQKNKVRNTNWGKLKMESIPVVFANEIAPKPSEQSFNFLRTEHGIKEKETLMIGDSDFDRDYAQNCNIDFMFIDEFKNRMRRNE